MKAAVVYAIPSGGGTYTVKNIFNAVYENLSPKEVLDAVADRGILVVHDEPNIPSGSAFLMRLPDGRQITVRYR